MTIHNLLQRRAKENPDRTFLVFEGKEFSYHEINAQSDRFAGRLMRLGVLKGDHVALLLDNSPQFLFAWFGILKAGAAIVPINPNLKPAEITYIRENSDSRILVSANDLESEPENIPKILPEIESKDLAAIVYTSGTTGKPKGAMLTHSNYLWDAEAIVEHVRMTSSDRFLCILPLFHVNAQVVTTLAPLIAGAGMVLMRKFSPMEMLQTLAGTGATAFSAVPTVYAILNNTPGAEDYDLSRLRFCICGAAPMPVEVFKEFERKFHAVITEGYGLTEGTCASSINPLDQRKIGSIGVPLRGQDMKIVDGEIVIRGPNVMKGYYKNQEATAETIRDGWLHTGDLGKVDEDGFFTIIGRKKEMIIRGGENIYPKEIEEVLYQHPAVAEAAVVGIPHPMWGEEVVAFIVLRGQASETELTAFCSAQLADFKCPKKIVLTDSLPKTATGKIQKHLLK